MRSSRLGGLGASIFCVFEYRDEFLHSRLTSAIAGDDGGEGAGHSRGLDLDGGKLAAGDFRGDGAGGDDGGAAADLHGALHGLDVVEFIDGRDFHPGLAQVAVGHLARRRVGLESDEGLAGDRRERDALFPRERVARMADEDHRVLIENLEQDAWALCWKCDEADVCFARFHHLIHLDRAAVIDADIHLRKFFPERLKSRGEFMQADAENGCDAEFPGDLVFQFADPIFKCRPRGEHFAAGRVKGVAFRSRGDTAAAALKQRAAEARLQCADLLAHGALRDAVRSGRL